jgi:hypothetical protein
MHSWKTSWRLKMSKYLHSYFTICQGIYIDILPNCIVWDTLKYYKTFTLLFIGSFIC